MQCKPCRYTNRVQRDGGEIGLCWQHKKSKCRICGKLSDGKHYCIDCEHQSDILRWKNESRPLVFDEDHEYLQLQLRKERLWQSKYHFHRAVEVMFRALVLAMEAIWGGVRDPKEKPTVELKEAA